MIAFKKKKHVFAASLLLTGLFGCVGRVQAMKEGCGENNAKMPHCSSPNKDAQELITEELVKLQTGQNYTEAVAVAKRFENSPNTEIQQLRLQLLARLVNQKQAFAYAEADVRRLESWPDLEVQKFRLKVLSGLVLHKKACDYAEVEVRRLRGSLDREIQRLLLQMLTRLVAAGQAFDLAREAVEEFYRNPYQEADEETDQAMQAVIKELDEELVKMLGM